MKKKPQKKTGLGRVFYAFIYSCNGLWHAIRNETAFTQECCIIAGFTVLLFFLPLPATIKMILFLANALILITELLNSALEAIVDKVSPEYHLLAKQAKDMGSAAVFISQVVAAIFWIYAIYLVVF